MRWLLGLFALCASGVALTAGLTGCGDGDSGCETAQDCNDNNDCTRDACDTANGTCSNTPLADGALCEGGVCERGSCGPIASVFACTEQGIRDAIAEGGGPHAFDCNGPTTVAIEEGQIIIDNDVVLDGLGNLEVDGMGVTRVFMIEEGMSAELRRLGVTGGNTNAFGGGILNLGSATLIDCVVSESRTDLFGGGISNGDVGHQAQMTIVDSVVSNNTAESAGGITSWGTLSVRNSTVSDNIAVSAAGIGNAGAATVTNSTVAGNSALFLGGGIFNDALATLTVTNSTVSGNSADQAGGGMINWGTASVTNCTFANNTAERGSAIDDIEMESARLTFRGSLIDGECIGATIISSGYNLESPGNTCGLDDPTDKVDVTNEALNLGPLADNGGPTQTHALRLMPESAAIDAIPQEQCVDSDGNPLVADQRGQPRPETGGASCDIGAFELERGGQ